MTDSAISSAKEVSSQAIRANPANLALAFRFALREMRGGIRGFYIFLACIALGVAAITGVNSVARSITSGIVSQGTAILGADVSFSVVHRNLTKAESEYLYGLGTVSKIGTMRAMVRLPDGSDQSLVEIKAIDNMYPLYGSLDVAPANATKDVGILVDPLLLDRLSIKVGDTLSVGKASVPIAGTIVGEPDRVGDGVGFGPKVLMSQQALDTSALVQPGSLVRWQYRIRLDDSSEAGLQRAIDDAKQKFPKAGWRIRSRSNAAPALSRNIERFTQFLTLVGLTALIVGGVGVANAVRAFLDTKRHVIASFKCLGAPAGFVFAVYLLQILILTSIGVLIGLVIGALMPIAAKYALAGIIPVGGSQVFYPAALGMGAIYGYLTALAFAVWPLGRARDVPATALFRNQGFDQRRFPAFIYVAITALVVLVLVLLAIALSGDRFVASVFVGAIACAFVLLRLVSVAIQWLAKRTPQVKSTKLRMALGNIHRPGALTPSVVLSLGLGLALLVALALIDGNLRNQISSNIPEQAPDFFFVDVQNTQVNEFRDFLTKVEPGGTLQTVPMLRGRIVRLKGIASEDYKVVSGGEWVLRGDRGITYSANLPENSTLSKGEWWPDNYDGPPLISFSEEEALEIGVDIGDEIEVNVLGRSFVAKIANLRAVQWESLGINFVMVFSPNTFAGAPHSFLATLMLEDKQETSAAETARDAEVLKAITNTFPTVTSVRVRDALTTVNTLIGQLATAIRAAAALALVASILVLGGALAAGHRSRIHDAVVLKTLGATRGTLVSAFTLEYFILGLATAIFALMAGGLASWFVISQIMGFKALFLWPVAVMTLVIALLFTVGFGLIGTWRVLGQKAAPVLREL